MIVKEEFLSKIRSLFGLNLYEAKIWTALLSRGVSTAGELSDIGDVPRSRAYDVLESLEKKGFIIMKLGKPIKYLAIEPKGVIEKVKKYVNNETLEKIKRLENLKGGEVLEELDALHNQGIDYVEPSDLAGALRGRHNIYTHLEAMVKEAEKSVVIMTSSKGVMRKIEALKPEFNRLKKKGVEIRIAAPVTKDAEKSIKGVSKVAEVRHTTEVKSRFCIVDNKDLMFMVMNDEEVHPTYDVGVWVQTPYFASAMQGMFDKSWNNMKPASSILN
ncbi:TrmB family transcriptional regulator [Candidatus Woesearchaeota archaeon]|jgi:sugar-specific transcriptional regulator TrmB|nr:TrmB family transcriptional regulator [Candidatus Woesearchaeota archaeon]MBT3438405.1 TrmB family transcriptional regulator [Candidatus Woesearchaeota archaeon]MBT4058275.1 TrmB family transcriptional regulator [Candidatus Woesearchaeota archaeon]MBT4209246.1 TrmB family transcriptional regulator [Candidatus Woesearchaeota archaeon]MBT4732174.1 TrmB family transcriptional regulator [Candidatus Woesearchaeota archaeon]